MRCLFCYQPLEGTPASEFHATCANKIFGTDSQPEIDIDERRLREQVLKVTIHGAIPGVQPKMSLELDPKRERLTVVGYQGDFILKIPSQQFFELPENEDVTMHLANAFGMKTALHSLVRTTSGTLAYITRRFDRYAKDGMLHRVAVEDMCQLAGKLTEDKYKGSMELVARIVRTLAAYPTSELHSLFELTLFSFLTGNSDMHLKNFSLMRQPTGAITFTPCYDLLSVALAMPADTEELAMSLHGKKQKITLGDMNAFAAYCGLTTSERESFYKRGRAFLTQAFAWIDASFLSATARIKYKELLNTRANRLGLVA